MLKIAMTGPTGSGKGYVSTLLSARGIPTLDTDLVVHRIYEEHQTAEELCRLFETDLTDKDGGVDRKKLGALVFKNEEKMNELLSFVYPLVRKECNKFLENAEKEGRKAAVVDAPQLFEAGFDGDYDRILCISAPPETRMERIILRDGITREEALLRAAHQMTDEEYAKRCDAVLENVEGGDAKTALDALLCAWGVTE